MDNCFYSFVITYAEKTWSPSKPMCLLKHYYQQPTPTQPPLLSPAPTSPPPDLLKAEVRHRQMLCIDSNFFNSPHLWREQKQSSWAEPIDGTAMTFENHRYPQLIEGCLFLEHISSKKNVINLNCKFAFINYMVSIHTLLYYNKKKSLI